MTDIATHTRPEERPDWQRDMRLTEYRYRRTAINPAGAALPVHRVKAISRPHPWPQTKQVQDGDFITKRFTEVK